MGGGGGLPELGSAVAGLSNERSSLMADFEVTQELSASFEFFRAQKTTGSGLEIFCGFQLFPANFGPFPNLATLARTNFGSRDPL